MAFLYSSDLAVFVSEFFVHVASNQNALLEAILVMVATSCEFLVSRLCQYIFLPIEGKEIID